MALDTMLAASRPCCHTLGIMMSSFQKEVNNAGQRGKYTDPEKLGATHSCHQGPNGES